MLACARVTLQQRLAGLGAALRCAALHTSARLERIQYAVHRDYEAEALAQPRVRGPTSRQRRLLPPKRKVKRLDSVLRGRKSQQGVQASQFAPLEGGAANALSLLRSQPSIYAQFFLGRHLYVVTSGDLLTTHHLPDTKVGDVVRFNRVVEVGSRDYTMRIHAPRLGEDFDDAHYFAPAAVSVCGVVVEHTRSNVRYTFRRGLRLKRLRGHVNGYTRIRVGQVKLGQPTSLAKSPLPLSDRWHPKPSRATL